MNIIYSINFIVTYMYIYFFLSLKITYAIRKYVVDKSSELDKGNGFHYICKCNVIGVSFYKFPISLQYAEIYFGIKTKKPIIVIIVCFKILFFVTCNLLVWVPSWYRQSLIFSIKVLVIIVLNISKLKAYDIWILWNDWIN